MSTPRIGALCIRFSKIPGRLDAGAKMPAGWVSLVSDASHSANCGYFGLVLALDADGPSRSGHASPRAGLPDLRS